MMEFDTKGLSLKRVLQDRVCVSTIVLMVLSWISWFFFLIYVYPIQFIPGKMTYACVGLIGSFVVLLVVVHYIDGIFNNRIWQLRRLESKRKFRKEMRELRQNWEIMKETLEIDSETVEEMEEMLYD